jgi:hypothetical protein
MSRDGDWMIRKNDLLQKAGNDGETDSLGRGIIRGGVIRNRD